MKKISVSDVAKNFGMAVIYFIVGGFIGTAIGFSLFYIDESLLARIIQLFSQRITFGEQYVGNYKIWFILNNLVATFLIVASTVFMMSIFLRKRKPRFFNRFKNFEARRPKVTLYSLYIIPIGALIINGVLISILLTYGLLNFGYAAFIAAVLLIVPHGMTEILSLIFAASMGLAYLEVLKPYILKMRWNEAKKIGKQLLFSKTTLIFIIFIALLVVFSGILEGNLVTLLQG